MKYVGHVILSFEFQRIHHKPTNSKLIPASLLEWGIMLQVGLISYRVNYLNYLQGKFDHEFNKSSLKELSFKMREMYIQKDRITG